MTLPSGASDDVAPSTRRVDVVRIKLDIILDHSSDLLEWKVTGIAGEPARMVSLLSGRHGLGGDPVHHADVVRSALLVVLQEHIEPF